MNGVSLKRLYEEHGARQTCNVLGQALQEGKLTPNDFSIKELAVTFLGEQWYDNLERQMRGGGLQIMEAGDAVDSTQFSNITGQLVVNKVMEGFESEENVATGLVPTVSTRLSGEKIPGIGAIEQEGDDVGEGMPYPEAGFAEDYIETPATTKDGLIVSVTKETIFFDRTGLVLRRASEVGERLGTKKEKAILDVLVGATNNFKWKGTSYNTYQTTTPWVNVKTGITFDDWNDIDTLNQVFTDMTHPDTGDPIVITPKHLVVDPSKIMVAKYILNATALEKRTNSAADVTHFANPLAGAYQALTSAMFKSRVTAAGGDNSWGFYGDIGKALAWMQNWPITVVQAASNSEAEFERDVVLRYKASHRGKCAVIQPRALIKFTS